MKIGAIFHGDVCLVPRVWNAVSAWERTRGLLGRPQLQAGEGMLIRDCRLVHTLGMGYALDLVFLDSRGTVRKLVRNVAPTRLAGSLQADQTLELASGSLTNIAIKVGDALTWREALQ